MIRILAIGLLIAAVAYWFYQRRERRSERLPAFDRDEVRSTLDARVKLWRELPAHLQDTLLERLPAFLGRVPFTGAGGFVVSDEHRLIISAQACLLTLGLDDDPYTALHGVTIYPDEFIVHERDEDEETGVVTEGYRALAGQALETDRIVLSWRDVEEAEVRDDGYHVIVHEFTHFLEHSRPGGDPVAKSALEECYASLCAACDRGEATLIDPYGAESLTEFLAVAAESFFTQPQALRREHPTLYVLLRESFKLDPASWSERSPAPAKE
jgi:Mlc titration factor MtfA (ptsG expression regulator)